MYATNQSQIKEINMAHFANIQEAKVFFEKQCSLCVLGDVPCKIQSVQGLYNFDAHNNKVATAILDHLVGQDGTCHMFRLFTELFALSPKQPKPLGRQVKDRCRKIIKAIKPKKARNPKNRHLVYENK